jgi:hypothetical protein
MHQDKNHGCARQGRTCGTPPPPEVSKEALEKIHQALDRQYGAGSEKLVDKQHVTVDSESNTAFVVHPDYNMGKVIIIDLATSKVRGFAG